MHKRLTTISFLVIALIYISSFCLSPTVAWAQPGPGVGGDIDDPPGGPGGPDGGDGGNGDGEGDGGEGSNPRTGPLQRIVQTISHVMTFPIETMTAALKKSLGKILEGAVENAADPFVEAVDAIVFGDASGGPSEGTYGPAWRIMRNVSAPLWALTLAMIVANAARYGVSDNPVSFANLKDGLIRWVSSIILAVASAFIIGMGLDIARGISEIIMKQLWGSVSAATLVGVFFNIGLLRTMMKMIPGASMFFGLFMLIFGFTMCVTLIFAFLARYTLLLLLISIAPLVITLGAVQEFRWLFWLWLKGITITLLLGPANAMLLKLAGVASASGLDASVSGLFGGIVKFLVAGGVLSVLLAVDYAVIRGVFGALGEIASKAKSSVQGVVSGLVMIGGAALTGGLAAAGAGAAGAGGLLGGGGGGAAAGAGGGAAAAGAGGGAAAGAGSAGGAGAATAAASATAAAEGGAGGAGGAAAAAGEGGGGSGGGGGPSGGGSRGGGNAPQEKGAGATRAALDDPGFLNRMGAILNTAGQAGMASRNPVLRAAAGAARGIGSTAQDRGRRIERGAEKQQHESNLTQARQEARVRAQHRGWQGLLDANGINPNQEGFMGMARSLSRLSDRYGGDEVRRSAPDVVQGMVAAAKGGGIPFDDQAQSAGYESPADYLGGETEQRIWARSGRPTGEPVFPMGGSMSEPGSWDAGPSSYDYRVGGDLARTIGREGADTIDAYARLNWALRDPALGAGKNATDQLYAAAGQSAELGREARQEGAYRQNVWPSFAQQATQVASGLGLEEDDLPSSWLEESAYLKSQGQS